MSPHPLKGNRTRSRATLTATLRDLLDDGTVHTHPALAGLLKHLAAMPEPDRGNCWIHNNSHGAATLRVRPAPSRHHPSRPGLVLRRTPTP